MTLTRRLILKFLGLGAVATVLPALAKEPESDIVTMGYKGSGKRIITECCHREIEPMDRYCPSCGWECRIIEIDGDAPMIYAPWVHLSLK